MFFDQAHEQAARGSEDDSYQLPEPYELASVAAAVKDTTYNGDHVRIPARLIIDRESGSVPPKAVLADRGGSIERHLGSAVYPSKPQLKLVGDHHWLALIKEYINRRIMQDNRADFDDDYNMAAVTATGVLMLAEGDDNHVLVVTDIRIDPSR